MDTTDSADSILSGNGSETDWIANLGGDANPYILNQTGADALDNGLVTATPNVSGGSTANYTPPSWFTGLLNDATQISHVATTIAPLVNGQPQGSAGITPGKAPAAGAATVKPSAGLFGMLPNLGMFGGFIYLGVGLLAVWWFLFRKKR